jgi:transcriptional regulator with XRE-family HTH domain
VTTKAKKKPRRGKLPRHKLVHDPERLKRYRFEAGLEQAELAAKVGCTQPHISDLERGWANPRVGLLKRLAEVLGREIVDLMQPDPHPTPGHVSPLPARQSVSADEPAQRAS